MDLTDIHNLLNEYEKIKLSLIRIQHSYSCKNRNRRVTVMKIKKKKKMAGKRLSHSLCKDPICISFNLYRRSLETHHFTFPVFSTWLSL